MYRYEDLAFAQTPLPEDILKKKWAGDFDGAMAAIDARLQKESLPPPLSAALRVQREMIRRLQGPYTLTRAQALSELREAVPDIGEAEFEALENAGWLDFLYVRGEKMYFKRAVKTLLKAHAGIAARAGRPFLPEKPELDGVIRRARENGSVGARIRLRAKLRVKDEAFIPGETYRAYLPIPLQEAQQSGVSLLFATPQAVHTDSEHAGQRTICFEKTLEENETFEVEYAYENVIRYVDTDNLPSCAVYPRCAPPCEDDLAQLPPHITFTPYLRALYAHLAGGEREPLKLARRFYDFITTQVNYSFMRPYFLLEHGAEYAAVNLKGDCGLQALLFIALCRMAGIPARWQSGLYVGGEGVGSHDWAQFYLPQCGWLFADCSFGGSAYRAGAYERWNFYFGNLDPYRMAANNRYMAMFSPAMRHARVDPYDNQEGECETQARSFMGHEVDTCREALACELI